MNTLIVGFTPDPDDAFSIFALATGQIGTRDFKLRFRPEPIEVLNRLTCRGELAVAAISSAFYPHIQGTHAVLRVGASVGRGYGPALVARSPMTIADLAGKRVAVPGTTTTGATLLRMFQPAARCVAMNFDAIRQAVVAGKVDAGVLIHEELLNYRESGLLRVLCLGQEWTRQTGLPLPVGLNVIRRDLPPDTLWTMAGLLRDSIAYGLEHPQAAFDWARRFARSPTTARSRQFTEMFTNSDTLWLGEDCEVGLRTLFDRLHADGLAPPVAHIDLVDPDTAPVPAGPAGEVAPGC